MGFLVSRIEASFPAIITWRVFLGYRMLSSVETSLFSWGSYGRLGRIAYFCNKKINQNRSCMKRLVFAFCVSLSLVGGLIACGDDTTVNEVPDQVTFGDYQFTCVDASTKNPVLDTLRFSAVGGTFSYDISLRRERFENGVSTGVFEYVSPSAFTIEGSSGFTPKLASSNAEHAATLSFAVDENQDPQQALEGNVVISASGNRMTLPIKQAAATMDLIGDPAIYHTALADKVIYLDHKGDTIQFEAVLATPYAINGNLVEDMLWTKEDAKFSYSLSDDTWIKVVDVTSGGPGIFVLHIATVPTPDTYNAVLTLHFEWDGQSYKKDVNLQSTEVFHVEFN